MRHNQGVWLPPKKSFQKLTGDLVLAKEEECVCRWLWGVGTVSATSFYQLNRTDYVLLVGVEHIELLICECKTAGEQLMARGLFPCAPKQPSMAFDINMLELVTSTMFYIAPNISGWSLGLEWFWKTRGYVLGARENLKRRFSTAYLWFNVLRDQVERHVQDIILTETSKATAAMLAMTTPHTPIPVVRNSTSSGPLSETPQTRQCPSGSSTPGMVSHGNTEARKLPSEVLRHACPLCFGGGKPLLLQSRVHCIVAIDANFSQKCLKGRVVDLPVEHPESHFLPPERVQKMETIVEELRKKKPKNGINLKLPEDIMKECEDSFIAAQEGEAKASVVVYADTGLVALVCRHDRPLWVINMTTPGERQYYAFALLEFLFDNIPEDWHVGVLYDIGCQVERSMLKHGILAHLYPRMLFAVSIFHCYGHQWACQLKYHPRKICGLGLSDGEGCERFWSYLKRLIPSLRVSGRYRRRWMLDRQIHHLKSNGLRNLGRWIARRRKACIKKEIAAREILTKHNIPVDVLRNEWADQVEMQSAPLKRRSKKAGDNVIEEILDLQEQRQEIHIRLLKVQAALTALQDTTGDDYKLTQEELEGVSENYDSIKRRIASREKSLGLRSPAMARLKKLKGSVFLRHRVNVNALKARIRSKLVARKFERARLERAYHHQVLRDKDHQQTKNLLKRSKQSISMLIARYNRLIDEMKAMKRRGAAPHGARVPDNLEITDLFRLDVDDAIWLDDIWDDEDDQTPPPRWLADEGVRQSIPALLEVDRIVEEKERLDAEERAMRTWLREELSCLESARLTLAGEYHS
ncbi:hypothetical protein M422DRAFT_174688 [Sphaerobolus stellatus SS14]|uniref:Unplaced genomic scaffold SPHSTscaffold_74, whole genome shotgun sequence n=1 Tax=Sphaerobolus stellatus (strain SS14) TaxID=990650 RepID=A0A0C9VPI7_SPHS4|nr:hypothetical protein M422DRAFT_174688 [Sphaerobolus stellatus SS14]